MVVAVEVGRTEVDAEMVVEVACEVVGVAGLAATLAGVPCVELAVVLLSLPISCLSSPIWH